MKRFLLTILSVMAFAGMTVAQDVYSVGYYTPSGESYTKVAVYKNGSMLYSYGPNSSFNYQGVSVDRYNGDVYWAYNAYRSSDNDQGSAVYKNGSAYLNITSSTGTKPKFYKVTVDRDYSAHVVATVGSMLDGGVRKAVMWSGTNATPSRVYGTGNYTSEATSAVWQDGWVYACGYQYTSESAYEGKVWKADEVVHTIANAKIWDIAYYNGTFYTVGTVLESGAYKLRVWSGTSTLYTLVTSNASNRASITIDAGDIYVTSYGGAAPDKVWKNGTEIYSDGGFIYGVTANTNGVFYVGGTTSGAGKVWKDGSVLYSPSNCTRLLAVYMDEPECDDTDIISLPFTDGFENGETSWPCWTKIDVDNNNDGYVSYWTRGGEHPFNNYFAPATGDYCAYHRYGDASQEGWLISPKLFLQPGRDNTSLTFKSCLPRSNYYYTEGCSVWISTTNTNTSSFTKIWEETSPSSSWSNKTVSLSDYQGQAVYIAFKFVNVPSGGGNNHCWLIDDVNVTESWSPCSTQDVPYTMDFSSGNEPGYCWYIWDGDMSGGNKCWRSDNSDFMYHPWGQSGVPQEGWVFSPRVNLPSGNYNYTLSFDEKNLSSGSNMKNSVWIAIDKTGTPNPADYTKIWEASSYPSSWTTQELDLSSYKGHTVNIAFKYEGTYAHEWQIDNFSIEQGNTQYTITANANNNAWGTVTGGGTYNAGETCTLTATPASGYQFQSWKKNGTVVSTNPNYSFTVTESATYTAYFGEIPVNYYTITTNVTPAGSGTVTGAGTYQEGSTVTLTATPNSGYTFSQWQDGNTDNPRTITVTQNATYTATFIQDNYIITVNASPANGGTVTGGGAYHYGETATLTATPNTNFEFQGWSDGIIDNPRTVTVTGNATYTAVFSESGAVYYTITTNVNPEGAGTVTGGGTYEEGTAVTLTATANAGYTFSHWNDGSTQNPRSITVTSSMSFTAYFNQNMYTITVVANPSNGGTVSGGGSYAYGTYATLMATPYSGYDFAGWSDGSSENPHQVLVTGNATYTATFSQGGATYYTVSAYVSPAGSGSVTGTGTYQAGATCTLTAVANSGYTFDHWNDGNTQNPRTVTVNNNMSFTAYFTSGQYTITVVANPSVGGTVTGGGTYAYGATAVLTATPNSGYEFLQWSDGVTLSTRIITVTGNATYTALFSNGSTQFYTLTVRPNSPFLGETSGSGTYPAGSVVEISAYPTPYARFIKWNDGNTENPRSVVVNSDMEFIAEFGTAQQYTIDVVSSNETMGQAYGGGTFTEGDVIEISAVAYSGYVFTGWQDGNTQNPRSITVTGNATYTANFAENSVTTYTITLICNTSEGTVSGGGVYVAGTVAYVQAFPNDGFEFDKWNDGSTDNPREITVNSDMTLVAFFKGTGIDEGTTNPLTLYPNPAKETIRILGIEANSSVEIYNSLGELVRTVNAGPDQEISVRDLAAGLYLVRCGNHALRFVKEL